MLLAVSATWECRSLLKQAGFPHVSLVATEADMAAFEARVNATFKPGHEAASA